MTNLSRPIVKVCFLKDVASTTMRRTLSAALAVLQTSWISACLDSGLPPFSGTPRFFWHSSSFHADACVDLLSCHTSLWYVSSFVVRGSEEQLCSFVSLQVWPGEEDEHLHWSPLDGVS